MQADFIFVLRWWGVLLAIGLIFFPLTRLLFSSSKDRFYIFSKIIGLGIIAYLSLLLGTLHILPFSTISVLLLLLVSLVANGYIWKKYFNKDKFKVSKIIIFEEILFLAALTFWSFVRAHEPSIHGLEKYMDFGFVNSILRTDYFPPKDMWFTPLPINYYFFGHLVTAILIKLSLIPGAIAYNLMIATLFAFTVTGGFTLLYNFLTRFGTRLSILGGILGGTLLSLGGNIHTLYAFFASYTGENPVPPWSLSFLPNNFPNNYWYPNATRFIPFTIHEFPIYSFVVSDLHGHVLDIPFVLTTVALLYTVIKNRSIQTVQLIMLSLLLAIMYMTNVWDGIIYLMLTFFVLTAIYLSTLTLNFRKDKHSHKFKSISNIKVFLENVVFKGGIIILLYAAFTLPFSLFFKPFVSGIGVLCAPSFLINLKKVGPFIFEAEHCQHSPFYQLLILYGFFYFFAILFFVFCVKRAYTKLPSVTKKLTYNVSLPTNTTNIFVLLLIFLATVLIIVPELLYAKDIYPQHFRANTMFKLVYQSFILLSLTSAYIIIFFAAKLKRSVWKLAFFSATFVLLTLVFIYPYFAIKSYYGDLQNYTTLNGTLYLRQDKLGDLEAIAYINNNIKGQPVILEAQGDSYTDYARISANTGLPTVLGWTVHEWLWRGTYDIPAPRIDEIKTMYEGPLEKARLLYTRYNVSYIVVGDLERGKYPSLNSDMLNQIGKTIFTSSDGKTKILKVNE